jgi:hypothetical protein
VVQGGHRKAAPLNRAVGALEKLGYGAVGDRCEMSALQRHVSHESTATPKHPEVSEKDFEAALMAASENDLSLLNPKRAATSAADAAGTKAIVRAKKYNKRVTEIVFGGAIELGKRK